MLSYPVDAKVVWFGIGRDLGNQVNPLIFVLLKIG